MSAHSFDYYVHLPTYRRVARVVLESFRVLAHGLGQQPHLGERSGDLDTRAGVARIARQDGTPLIDGLQILVSAQVGARQGLSRCPRAGLDADGELVARQCLFTSAEGVEAPADLTQRVRVAGLEYRKSAVTLERRLPKLVARQQVGLVSEGSSVHGDSSCSV